MRMTKKHLETIKTILLNVLVVLSLVLTWQIWTFEPDYERETTPSENRTVGVKEVDLSQVVKPNQIVFHQNDSHYTSFERETIDSFYTDFISGTRIKSVTMVDNIDSLINREESIEFIFPTSLSNDVLKSLVSVAKGDIPLEVFDRLIVPSAQSGKNNEVIFLNSSSQIGMRATVDVSRDMKEWFSEDFSSLLESNGKITRARSYQPNENTPIFYLPTNEIQMRLYDVRTDELTNIDAFITALFPDENAVEENTVINSSSLYTDGSRDLNYDKTNNYMGFINPPSTSSKFVANEAPILNAYGFVNKHFGFQISDPNDDYFLSEWVTSSKTKTDRITFRLNTEGYPVFSPYQEDLDEINVTLKNNEISTYKRMLKVVQFANDIETRGLPSYEKVVSLLDEGNFKKSAITNFTIGYTIDRDENSNQDFVLMPQWYVKLNQSWTPLENLEQGGNDFGLE
ncbi:YycH family regulatory protein [Alkalihalobacillus sp. CinArs1]|uniref:YycH family regulatory protein n=1 Tax=Alkalihalobacillus sp. CinArs1 TaxID=2995314 RepID=UPI0022DD1EC0|nr:two-component system activity regulator YycH [Alkalihalobacillus sp. CinArs1]